MTTTKAERAGAVCDGCGAENTVEKPLKCEKKMDGRWVFYAWYCPICRTPTAEVDGEVVAE